MLYWKATLHGQVCSNISALGHPTSIYSCSHNVSPSTSLSIHKARTKCCIFGCRSPKSLSKRCSIPIFPSCILGVSQKRNTWGVGLCWTLPVMEKTPSKMINQGAQVQIDCDQPVTAILQFIEHLAVQFSNSNRSPKRIGVDKDRFFATCGGCPFRHDRVPPVIIHFEYTIFPEMDKLLG